MKKVVVAGGGAKARKSNGSSSAQRGKTVRQTAYGYLYLVPLRQEVVTVKKEPVRVKAFFSMIAATCFVWWLSLLVLCARVYERMLTTRIATFFVRCVQFATARVYEMLFYLRPLVKVPEDMLREPQYYTCSCHGVSYMVPRHLKPLRVTVEACANGGLMARMEVEQFPWCLRCEGRSTVDISLGGMLFREWNLSYDNSDFLLYLPPWRQRDIQALNMLVENTQTPLPGLARLDLLTYARQRYVTCVVRGFAKETTVRLVDLRNAPPALVDGKPSLW